MSQNDYSRSPDGGNSSASAEGTLVFDLEPELCTRYRVGELDRELRDLGVDVRFSCPVSNPWPVSNQPLR
jgi:hypothetical protein